MGAVSQSCFRVLLFLFLLGISPSTFAEDSNSAPYLRMYQERKEVWISILTDPVLELRLTRDGAADSFTRWNDLAARVVAEPDKEGPLARLTDTLARAAAVYSTHDREILVARLSALDFTKYPETVSGIYLAQALKKALASNVAVARKEGANVPAQPGLVDAKVHADLMRALDEITQTDPRTGAEFITLPATLCYTDPKTGKEITASAHQFVRDFVDYFGEDFVRNDATLGTRGSDLLDVHSLIKNSKSVHPKQKVAKVDGTSDSEHAHQMSADTGHTHTTGGLTARQLKIATPEVDMVVDKCVACHAMEPKGSRPFSLSDKVALKHAMREGEGGTFQRKILGMIGARADARHIHFNIDEIRTIYDVYFKSRSDDDIGEAPMSQPEPMSALESSFPQNTQRARALREPIITMALIRCLVCHRDASTRGAETVDTLSELRGAMRTIDAATIKNMIDRGYKHERMVHIQDLKNGPNLETALMKVTELPEDRPNK